MEALSTGGVGDPEKHRFVIYCRDHSILNFRNWTWETRILSKGDITTQTRGDIKHPGFGEPGICSINTAWIIEYIIDNALMPCRDQTKAWHFQAPDARYTACKTKDHYSTRYWSHIPKRTSLPEAAWRLHIPCLNKGMSGNLSRYRLPGRNDIFLY